MEATARISRGPKFSGRFVNKSQSKFGVRQINLRKSHNHSIGTSSSSQSQSEGKTRILRKAGMIDP
jgi:hypothetical protein